MPQRYGRFSKLSPELRNRIYEFALASPKPITLVTVRQGATLKQLRRFHGPTRRTALAATSSQIRKECTRMFYSTNTFVVPLPIAQIPNGRQRLEAFLETIGAANVAALRKIIINVEDTGAEDLDRDMIPYRQLPGLVRDLQQLLVEKFGPSSSIQIQANFTAGAPAYGAKKSVPLELDVRDPESGWSKARERVQRQWNEEESGMWNLIEVGVEQCWRQQARL
jgi:hypothetical protein